MLSLLCVRIVVILECLFVISRIVVKITHSLTFAQFNGCYQTRTKTICIPIYLCVYLSMCCYMLTCINGLTDSYLFSQHLFQEIYNFTAATCNKD